MFIFAQFCFILIGLNGLAADAEPKLDELKIEEIKTNKSEEIKVLGIIAKNNVANENGTLAAENELEIDETKGNNKTESKVTFQLCSKDLIRNKEKLLYFSIRSPWVYIFQRLSSRVEFY
jgi:hypothetical protein